MIQNTDILKSYFEIGDFPTEAQFADLIDSFVHKDEGGSSTSIGTIFIDAVNGDDATAKIEKASNPYKTIDAAMTAYNTEKPRENTTIDHLYVVLKFMNQGSYEWNTLIPERNIIIDTANYKVEIDFSNNTNDILNEITGTVGHPFNFIVKGEFLTIKNHSDTKIYHKKMNFYGVCDVVDSRRAGFGGFTQPFLTAEQIKIKYNLIKGYGNVFSSYGTASSNEFIGNIAAEGHLALNNQGNGASLIDFDTATSTGKVLLFKPSWAAQKITILFGECLPNTAGNLTEGGATIDIICKHNAKSAGTFQGILNFSGHSLEAIHKIARIGSTVTFTKIKLTLSQGIASFYSHHGKIILNDCLVEIKDGGLFFIETDTNFTAPILELIGHNTILHETVGTPLITKFITANPTNVSYKQCTAGGLKTNAVLNTVITGNTNTEATLITETTNTY